MKKSRFWYLVPLTLVVLPLTGCLGGGEGGSGSTVLDIMRNPVMLIILFFAFLYIMIKGRRGG